VIQNHIRVLPPITQAQAADRLFSVDFIQNTFGGLPWSLTIRSIYEI